MYTWKTRIFLSFTANVSIQFSYSFLNLNPIGIRPLNIWVTFQSSLMSVESILEEVRFDK